MHCHRLMVSGYWIQLRCVFARTHFIQTKCFRIVEFQPNFVEAFRHLSVYRCPITWRGCGISKIESHNFSLVDGPWYVQPCARVNDQCSIVHLFWEIMSIKIERSLSIRRAIHLLKCVCFFSSIFVLLPFYGLAFGFGFLFNARRRRFGTPKSKHTQCARQWAKSKGELHARKQYACDVSNWRTIPDTAGRT